MSKRFLTVIAVLLGIVVVFWIGVSVYGAAFDIEVNPNAEQFVPKIAPSFDMETVDEVTERVKILPVSPKVFHELSYDDPNVEGDEKQEGDGENTDDEENQDEENENSDE